MFQVNKIYIYISIGIRFEENTGGNPKLAYKIVEKFTDPKPAWENKKQLKGDGRSSQTQFSL